MAQIEYRLEKLSARNYSTWKTVMKSHLLSKELWDYAAEHKLESDKDEIKNEQAKHLMYVAMEPQQIAATGVCETAHDLWNKIKENHEGAEANLRSTALAEFLGLKYRKNESLINYAGRYELLLGRLESTDHKIDEQTRLWVFSNSLPQHMKQTVHMFTMAKAEPRVTELITQLKNQYHMDTGTNNESTAFHMNEAYETTQNRPNPQQNRPNQQRDRPTSQQNRPNSQQNRLNLQQNRPNQNQVTCNYCKKIGHMWRECRKLKADNDRKKRYSEANRNNTNGQQKTGAFRANAHEFSQGKFTWIVDSGASSHMTPYKEYLTDYEEFKDSHQITLGNGKHLAAYGIGNMPFTSNRFVGELKRVLYVPKICENLFSVGRTMELGCTVEFKQHTVQFHRGGQTVLTGARMNGSNYFLLNLRPTAASDLPNECALIGASLTEWHKRLGHCSIDAVRQLIKHNAATGIQISNEIQPECYACIMGKLCRSHHPIRSELKASDVSAVIHFDTVGPMKTPSLGQSRYFLLATEEYSGYKYIETVTEKSSITNRVKCIVNQTELESNRPVKSIVTDQGTEFTCRDLHNWLSKRGIIHCMSAPYTPQQNGRAERANRTVLDGIRTLLHDSKLPEELWAEAAKTVVYTTNRLVGKAATKTHYELLRGNKPDLSNLRVFGQHAIVRIPDPMREGKLAARGEEARFVGYTERRNTFRFYTQDPYQYVFESCDAKFISRQGTHIEKAVTYHVEILSGTTNDLPDNTGDSQSTETSNESTDENNETQYATTLESEQETSDDESTIMNESASPLKHSGPTDKTEHKSIMTRSKARALSEENAKAINESDDNETAEPIETHCGPALIGTHDVALFTLDDEPRTIRDARESDDWLNWQKAMDEEIHALEKNGTWELVSKPDRVKPIKNKWVYKIKLRPDGTTERYKARLVAKGYTQIPNVDYKETYAPVASMNTVRMFLAIANQHAMHIVQFDIKTAFLYGDLDETLYMEQPEGYAKDDKRVCKLIKSLYGLKQAPRQWNKKFDSFLKLFKLHQASVDKCLYFSEDRSLLLAIYVDDGLAAGTNRKELDKLIHHLKANFELKVMECDSFLGFKISRDLKARTLSITQSHYIDKILSKFGMADSNPVDTPEQVGVRFDESPELPVDNKFKELAGSLLYLVTCTRPDIAHAVSIATRTSQPTQAHWASLKRILRYLKGTRELGIRFRWEEPTELIGYSDADYANDEETRKSTTGLCILYGGGPIAWRCQRQPIITLSTTEAEYVAGCELVKELLPIREQLVELKEIRSDQPTTVYIDNQSTVRIATNEGGQSRTKHIDIRQKWLTEQAQLNKITVKHISGDEQAADILTKPLYKSKFIANRSKLLTHSITMLCVVAFCFSGTDARNLRETDPITTVKSEYNYIKGDTRYRLMNMFVNPCEMLFNYSYSVTTSEQLVRHCTEYYQQQILGSLSNCRQLPTIGPDLMTIAQSYDCVGDHYSSSNSPHTRGSGKCDVVQKIIRPAEAPPLQLDRIQGSWERHKARVANMPVLVREKRIIPVIFGLGAIFIATASLGQNYKTYQITTEHTKQIDLLINSSNLHTSIIQDQTNYVDQYKETVEVIKSWSEEVELRLGSDPMDSRLNKDFTYKGKKAALVRTYMQWFDAQNKLLQDINRAAYSRKIPASLKAMVNLTNNYDTAANLSTLFDCNFHIENKSVILSLDFSIPTIDENIEILKLTPMDHYVTKTDANNTVTEACWNRYVGPTHVLHNKTNDCYTRLQEEKTYEYTVRAQTCSNNTIKFSMTNEELWFEELCTVDPPLNEDRIQIIQIDGIQKVYCYPFEIEINGETQACPNKPFMLENHLDYKVGNLNHKGEFIDMEVTRKVDLPQQEHSDGHKILSRRRRSPAPVQSSTTTVVPKQAETTVASTVHKPNTTSENNKPRIVKALEDISNRMNATLSHMKDSIKRLPGSLNLTRTDFESLFEDPITAIGNGLDRIGNYFRSIGSSMGIIGACMMFVMIMPALELIIIGAKLVKIPANLWLKSARRVTTQFREATSNTGLNLFKRRKKRWEQGYKGV